MNLLRETEMHRKLSNIFTLRSPQGLQAAIENDTIVEARIVGFDEDGNALLKLAADAVGIVSPEDFTNRPRLLKNGRIPEEFLYKYIQVVLDYEIPRRGCTRYFKCNRRSAQNLVMYHVLDSDAENLQARVVCVKEDAAYLELGAGYCVKIKRNRFPGINMRRVYQTGDVVRVRPVSFNEKTSELVGADCSKVEQMCSQIDTGRMYLVYNNEVRIHSRPVPDLEPYTELMDSKLYVIMAVLNKLGYATPKLCQQYAKSSYMYERTIDEVLGDLNILRDTGLAIEVYFGSESHYSPFSCYSLTVTGYRMLHQLTIASRSRRNCRAGSVDWRAAVNFSMLKDEQWYYSVMQRWVEDLWQVFGIYNKKTRSGQMKSSESTSEIEGQIEATFESSAEGVAGGTTLCSERVLSANKMDPRCIAIRSFLQAERVITNSLPISKKLSTGFIKGILFANNIVMDQGWSVFEDENLGIGRYFNNTINQDSGQLGLITNVSVETIKFFPRLVRSKENAPGYEFTDLGYMDSMCMVPRSGIGILICENEDVAKTAASLVSTNGSIAMILTDEQIGLKTSNIVEELIPYVRKTVGLLQNTEGYTFGWHRRLLGLRSKVCGVPYNSNCGIIVNDLWR